jgi:hypothetical protein
MFQDLRIVLCSLWLHPLNLLYFYSSDIGSWIILPASFLPRVWVSKSHMFSLPTSIYISAPNFIDHTLKDLKSYTDSNRVIVWNINIPYHQQIGHPNKKITKETLELNHTVDQTDLLMSTEYFIQLPHNIHSSQQPMEPSWIWSKIDHIFGHKASLSKYKKIKIILCILSDHNALN